MGSRSDERRLRNVLDDAEGLIVSDAKCQKSTAVRSNACAWAELWGSKAALSCALPAMGILEIRFKQTRIP